MTNDEIRKLLGGYATNNLTETERQALFEEALEDQELFDALHQEQALKELLADPISRAQIRQALEKPSAKRPRWWTWTAAASAVAAVVLVVAVIRSHTTQPAQQYAALPVPKPVTEQPPEKSESDAKAAPQPTRTRAAAANQEVPRPRNKRFPGIQIAPSPPTAAPTLPPPPELTASQLQLEGHAARFNLRPSQGRSGDTQAQSQQVVGGAINSLRDQEQSQVSPAQIKGAVTGAFFKSNSPTMVYTLLKRDADGNYQPLAAGTALKPGDAVRLSVIPITSGYLSLSRQDASGEWKRVFPETGPGLAVSTSVNYTIPASPIDVSDTDQNFRLTLAPTSMNASDKVKTRTLQLKKESPAIMQSEVDLTIGPRRVP